MAISRREKIIVAVTGVVLGAFALDRVILTPWLDRRADALARVDLAQQDLTRAQQTFQNDQRAQRNWRRMAGDTLRTDAPAAEAQVLNRVRDWAQDAGLSLTSLKPERNEREKGYHKVTIRATATGSMRGVSRFLFEVQNADVPLRVADMQLTSRKEGADDLTLNLGLSTIYLPPEEPRAAAGEATR